MLPAIYMKCRRTSMVQAYEYMKLHDSIKVSSFYRFPVYAISKS